MVGNLSPALELAVAMIAEGHTIPAYLCKGTPVSVSDIGRVRLGVGMLGGDGGIIAVDKPGLASCIAYDVRGQLVLTRPLGLPAMVHASQHCRVGPLTFGKDGKPHDA